MSGGNSQNGGGFSAFAQPQLSPQVYSSPMQYSQQQPTVTQPGTAAAPAPASPSPVSQAMDSYAPQSAPAPTAGAWDPSQHYQVGQQSVYNGGLYTAQGDGWNENSRPDQTPSLWSYGGVQSGANPMLGEWDAGTHYMPGQEVTRNGQTYQAYGDPGVWNENSAPEITSQLWRQVAAPAPAAAPTPAAVNPYRPPEGPKESFIGAAPEAWQFREGGIASLLKGRRK